MNDLHIFLKDSHFLDRIPEGYYEKIQIGAAIMRPEQDGFDLAAADMVLVGCADWWGANRKSEYGTGPDKVRKYFYQMYHWHDKVTIADLGDIRPGATPADTRSALVAVLQEVHNAGKTAIIIGGGHDLMLQQYEVYKRNNETAVATVVDMLIDLDETEGPSDKGFLMEMLTETPNHISHYNHLAFQIYYSHPAMVDTLNKLSFDLYRLAKLREDYDEIEPVVRRSNIMSFDMTAVRYCDAPANTKGSPNGLDGEEACMMAQFAGLADKLSSFGIYGYDETNDTNDMTARLIAQMAWYYADGCQTRKKGIADGAEALLEFYITIEGIDTAFVKNKYNNRWYVRLPQGALMPCSYKDYQIACSGELPERLLREMERLS